jgi:hypothetical protein
MGFWDYILIGLIAAGSVYVLYRSVWKKKGHCCGCSRDGCAGKGKNGCG